MINLPNPTIENTYLTASYELTTKEIATIFKQQPTTEFIKFPNGKLLNKRVFRETELADKLPMQ